MNFGTLPLEFIVQRTLNFGTLSPEFEVRELLNFRTFEPYPKSSEFSVTWPSESCPIAIRIRCDGTAGKTSTRPAASIVIFGIAEGSLE